jgi:hypothetical protein
METATIALILSIASLVASLAILVIVVRNDAKVDAEFDEIREKVGLSPKTSKSREDELKDRALMIAGRHNE